MKQQREATLAGSVASSNPKLTNKLLLSNILDAASYQLFDAVIAILVVVGLGFSATQMGLMNFLASLSFLLLAVPMGALVDKIGAGKALLIALAFKLLGVLVTLGLFATGHLSAPIALGIITLLGVLALLGETAQGALAPLLTSSKYEIAQVVAKMASADKIASIAAPALGGILVAFTGGAAGFAVAGLAGALALLFCFRLGGVNVGNLPTLDSAPQSPNSPAQEPQANESEPSKPFALHGFKVLFANRFLLATTSLVAAGNIGLALGDTLLDILELRILGINPAVYGLLSTGSAVAGIFAAILAPRVVKQFENRTIFTLGAIAQAAVAAMPLLAYGFAHNLWISYAAVIVFHLGWAFVLTTTNIAGAAYAMQVIPPEFLGRTIGARRMITMGLVPVAALASGILADATALWVPLLIWPALTLFAALLYFALTIQKN